MANPVRECGGCTLCCKVFGVAALDKPTGTWCAHCSVGSGCRIHDNRPEECRGFFCGYIMESELDDRWKPSESKLILVTVRGVAPGDIARVEIHVDPQRPNAWKTEPYFTQIKTWAAQGLAANSQVVVRIGRRILVVFPDREVDLGECSPGETIVTKRIRTAAGERFEANKIRADENANVPPLLSDRMPF